MKKRLFLPFICLILLLSTMSVMAADDPISNCKLCNASLYSIALPGGHWTTTHSVVLYTDNTYRLAECSIAHTMTNEKRICPNGHGVQWEGNWHSKTHTYCRSENYLE